MCYSVAYLEKKARKLAERYKDFLPEAWSDKQMALVLPHYYFVSGFSHPLLPVLRQGTIELMQWGLIPFWTKTGEQALTIRTQTLNARGESVFEKPSFRQAIRKQRGILPVSGFFEWRAMDHGKQPYFIFPKNQELFSLGCVWDEWAHPQTGEIMRSFSILTTEANALMQMIHNTKKRMPLILSARQEAAWLDATLDEAALRQLIRPQDDGLMDAYPVSRMLNQASAERNIARAIEKAELPGQQPRLPGF